MPPVRTSMGAALVHIACAALVAAAAGFAFESCIQHHSVYDDAFVLAMPDLYMPTSEWLSTGRVARMKRSFNDGLFLLLPWFTCHLCSRCASPLLLRWQRAYHGRTVPQIMIFLAEKIPSTWCPYAL